MAPVKFDDLSKTANEVLSDDYQTSGFLFKAKQKTNWGGAVLTSAVDLFPPKDSTATPAKITWKVPVAFVDKLELDKSGKFKMEQSYDKAVKGLKLESKTDCVNADSIVLGATYTGLADTQIKVEAKALKPQDFTAEVTRVLCPPATVGVKFGMKNLTAPDVGLRLTSGPFFASLLAKEQFSTFTGHLYYKVSDDIKCAASYQHGGKGSGAFSVGVAASVMKGTTLKAKVQQDSSASVTVKHEVAKGFTLLAGAKYDTKASNYTYGLQLSVE